MHSRDPFEHIDVRPVETLEPLWLVLIHNDNVTPYDFVIGVLMAIFDLSQELAEHITYVAHTRGVARVVSCSRREAERLLRKGHALAQLNGFPLTFSLEPDE
jgi:ATP-dependent Clp protease adaptor protein ClpS